MVSATEFLAASHVLVVTGKGGVGKSTLGATLGVAAAHGGLNVTVIELGGPPALGQLLGVGPLGYEATDIALPDRGRLDALGDAISLGAAAAIPGVRSAEILDGWGDMPGGARGTLRARRITAEDALIEFLTRQASIGRGVIRRILRTGVADMVATAAPGIGDLLALGKVRQLERAGQQDLLVVDAPAAGHALTFLQSAHGLGAVATTGPVHEQAEQARAMLSDAARCRVMLVTLAEETPVNETIEVAYAIEDGVGVALAPLVVNRWLPAIDPAEARTESVPAPPEPISQMLEHHRIRVVEQERQLVRLDAELSLARLRLPYDIDVERPMVGVVSLAAALTAQLDQLDPSEW